MTKTENPSGPIANPRRVYPLDAHDLTEEQIAVAFAMTSRRPEPFDEIAAQVSQEKAADFHERWVLGYGHASVAEHAVVHLAVENISRLACDGLEDNRLASYTEKSSRYQVIPPDHFFFPGELEGEPELGRLYEEGCRRLFRAYQGFIDGCIIHLRSHLPQGEKERENAYNMRLRRIATDSCRAVLPAATLTNVGVTANARVLEHAVSKLMSSGLDEERELGREVREQGHQIAPTLIKYADRNPYLADIPITQQAMSRRYVSETTGAPPDGKKPRGDLPASGTAPAEEPGSVSPQVRLVQWDGQAEEKLAAALLYRHSGLAFDQVWQQVGLMGQESRQEILDRCFSDLGDHDVPVRESELVDYTFEFVLDYGAYRELKRHRMMSYLPQPLTVDLGYKIPGPAGGSGPERRLPSSRRPGRIRISGGAKLLALGGPVPGDPRPLPPGADQNEPAGVLPPVQAADFRTGSLCYSGSDVAGHEARGRNSPGAIPPPAS